MRGLVRPDEKRIALRLEIIGEEIVDDGLDVAGELAATGEGVMELIASIPRGVRITAKVELIRAAPDHTPINEAIGELSPVLPDVGVDGADERVERCAGAGLRAASGSEPHDDDAPAVLAVMFADRFDVRVGLLRGLVGGKAEIVRAGEVNNDVHPSFLAINGVDARGRLIKIVGGLACDGDVLADGRADRDPVVSADRGDG